MKCITRLALFLAIASILFGSKHLNAEVASSYNHIPPFLTNAVQPLVMLVMGRDHTLYYEAYNDALDINGDGILDTKYNPDIDYYGYFDSYKYYEYGTNTFIPCGYTSSDKRAPDGNYWSGNFLNYMTMSRLDVVRKVLYGGFRCVDTTSETILERAYIPNDAHCWGKEYKNIETDGYDLREFTPLSLPAAGTRHLFASGSIEAYSATSNKSLLRIKLNSTKRVSEWVSTESGNGILENGPVGTPITDYQIRVKVGVKNLPDHKNEKLYTDDAGSSVYKPIGILQRYGESNRILFGLTTGSYKNHLSGGVLRKNIGSITNEINNKTGQFLHKSNPTIGGIIKTIDNFNIYGFELSTNNYWDKTIYSRPINQGENYMWGNPVGEMMYESLRYFSGLAPTSSFVADVTSGNDLGFDIPLETWKDPYASKSSGGLGHPLCAKPFLLVLSDINPSYDTNQLPGVYSEFATGFTGTFNANSTTFNAEALANTIFSHEPLSGRFYIGQSATNLDNSCSEKSISGFGNIRGLCPEEPTKLGGYYSAASAFYGKTNDINPTTEIQTVTTYSVALASPLPRIEIPMGSNFITLVPFSKTVKSSTGGGVSPIKGTFQPTCAIVDFYVEELTDTYGKFIVSFEHAEQGSDFDMDGLVQYEYTKTSNSEVEIKITNINVVEGGGSKQHYGYIISGTTRDGTYLEIKNKFHTSEDDPDYYLDTPPGVWPGQPGTPWDDDISLPNNATRTFTAGSATGATLLNTPLWYAAKWGGFEDKNRNNIPDLQEEWDKDWNGVPDTYFYVANPTKLEEQLEKSFADILRRTSSGTATSTHHQTRDGEGARYRAIFFPEIKDTRGNTINWAGHLHSMLMDKKGNIREDTNHNSRLDSTDKFIIYSDTTIYRYQDLDGDLALSTSEKIATAEVLSSQLDINYLWSATNWLNTISDAEIVTQRSTYNATTNNRYILTFADKNDNMVVEADEIQDFAWPPAASSHAGLTNSTDYFAFLTLFSSFENMPEDLKYRRDHDLSGFKTIVEELAERQIDFIRGADQCATTVAGYAINATRSRRYMENGLSRTWRLGDIVYSTPTVNGKPVELYHIAYKDRGYNNFVKQYANRRHMVYVGANDGMVHAFNGGFFNSTNTGFDLTRAGEVSFPLGMEIWAYVPYNILPHLLWLTEQSYTGQRHVSYLDLKPKIFDARIFFQPDTVTPLDSDHPGGWGTVLVSGMRLGGGMIRADLDKTDGMDFNATTDRIMSSAYVVMDVTNPEKPPRVLAELRLPGQGFTTCYPAVMPMTTANANATDGADNNWYLVFGSGPADATGTASPSALATATSSQNGKLFVLDLKALASGKTITTLNSAGHFTRGSHVFATTEPGSFITDPIAVDLDLGSSTSTTKMKTDLVYYGTTAGDQTDATGTMRRMIADNENPTGGFVPWTGNSTLMNVPGAVTVSPSPSLDETKQLWLYFGSGRFYTRGDIPQVRTTSFFGVKEPRAVDAFGRAYYTWEPVNPADLYNSTQITLSNGTCLSTFTRGCVHVSKSGTPMSGGWDQLEAEVDAAAGWRLDMPASWERIIQQAVTFGGLVAWPSYVPSLDLCSFEGESWTWAVYYKTGTAYFKPIFGNGNFSIKASLGQGVASSPGLHIGEDPNAIKLEYQMSDGRIVRFEVEPPFAFKSHPLFWIKQEGS